jgi:ribosomal protein L33
VSILSKVWKYSESSGISFESYYQAMAIQRMGYRLEFKKFAESMGIKLLNSSPYYAQANGQAEASNKIMTKIIQKKFDQKTKNSVKHENQQFRQTC